MEAKSLEIAKLQKMYKTEPYVGEDGIYVPMHPYAYEGTAADYKLIMSKELFQEAFKEYIVREGLLNCLK